jgi:hypothetical protein
MGMNTSSPGSCSQPIPHGRANVHGQPRSRIPFRVRALQAARALLGERGGGHGRRSVRIVRVFIFLTSTRILDFLGGFTQV